MSDAAFADRLRELARKYGWEGDYIEVAQFVEWVYDQLALPIPSRTELEPYR
jgi:hypothetical protein